MRAPCGPAGGLRTAGGDAASETLDVHGVLNLDSEPAQQRFLSALASRGGWRSVVAPDTDTALAKLGTQEGMALDAVLVPELRRCQTICVANKQTHDCVYFSGIDAAQLLAFLERLRYPRPIVAFVRENLGNLDHLLFDVGFDYRAEAGELAILKSGYYGVF